MRIAQRHLISALFALTIVIAAGGIACQQSTGPGATTQPARLALTQEGIATATGEAATIGAAVAPALPPPAQQIALIAVAILQSISMILHQKQSQAPPAQ